MAESVHVGAIAEKLSDEMFREFFWRKEGPTNQDWPCEMQEQHDHSTHPADVVFWYDEPYAPIRTYVHCDLKSYGKSSVKTNSVKKAALSLLKQVQCAEISETWQERYAHGTSNYKVVGLLFVYNHDEKYDGDFDKLLRGVNPDGLNTPSNSRLFIFGPDDILWLDNVRVEVALMRTAEGLDLIPPRAQCRYYYPQLTTRMNIRPEKAKAATLEMLTSSWILMEYDFPTGEYDKGYILFYKRKSVRVEEFTYLIDYLRHYQLLTTDKFVQIKFSADNEGAPNLFSKAVTQYIDEVLCIDPDEPLAKIIKRIRVKVMTHAVSRYSATVIGMDYERI